MFSKPAKGGKKIVETLKHDEASRKNIPTAEHQSVMDKAQQDPIRVAYERRNRDLDPQLVWREQNEQLWSDFVAQNSHCKRIQGNYCWLHLSEVKR